MPTPEQVLSAARVLLGYSEPERLDWLLTTGVELPPETLSLIRATLTALESDD